MTSQNRRRHIATASELARDLRFAAGRYDELSLRELDPAAMWSALQLHPELVARFRAFLEKLWFDGIRSRFFAEFDASRLILPIALEMAERLDMLVEELEQQAAALDENNSRRNETGSSEVRAEN